MSRCFDTHCGVLYQFHDANGDVADGCESPSAVLSP
jgi:hypothetical protein